MRTLIVAALLATAACTTTELEAPAAAAAETPYDLAASRAKIARIEMRPDTRFLNAEERRVVNLLIQAAGYMDEIYLRQVSPDNPTLRAEIARSSHPQKAALLDMFDLHGGVWDTLADHRPFYGGEALPEGAGFYPKDMTKAEFDGYLAANPGQKAELTGLYTVVKRRGARLVGVPYSTEYRQWLVPASRLLKQAAAATSNPSLKRFLSLRANSFLSDDYYQSELAWMDVTGTPIEVAIGPYEVYTDRLYGAKAAFEAFVTVTDPGEGAKLAKYKNFLRDMEKNLPVEARYKNYARGFASPILVADQVRGGGDNRPGVQTIAFNLPNDERVREAKGAKKVILANVLGAKYERVLKPMAPLILVPEQARLVTKRYMTNETLFHELSHSLGPGTITVGGRKTEVSAELKELNSPLEEGKADVMGAWNILYMMERGELSAAEKPELFASYFAGLFRAMRFGIDEAHGRGAAMQYGYFKEKGAFRWDAGARRFRIDNGRMESAIRDLVREVVVLQGNGDYAGTKAFLERYARLDDKARAVIASAAAIPTDIQPIYPERV